MIYDKIKIYPCITDNEPKEKISVCIYHNADDEVLVQTINSSLFKEKFDDVFIFIPHNKKISIDISNYPEYSWIFAYKEYDNIEILKILKREVSNNLVLFMQSKYKFIDFKTNSIISLFEKNKNLFALSPFIYDNNDNLYPSLSMPKIDNINISYIMIPPKYNLSHTLFVFDMVAVYNLDNFNLDIAFNTKYKDDNFRYFDYFTSYYLTGAVVYISSNFKVKFRDGYNHTVADVYKKDVKLASSKFMSFIKTASPHVTLKPFWWLNYNVINVVQNVLPFLEFAKQDFYNLVKNWRIEV